MHMKPRIEYDPLIEGATFRRYLDLTKFLDLLRSRSLYFRRADRLPDKFEGALPPYIRRAKYDADDFIRKVREYSYINCWTLGADDNMALWHLYSSASTGVSITCTLERLIQSCRNWTEEELIEIFKVKYIDHFKNPDMIIGTYSDPLRYKHKAYLYEGEVRIVVCKINQRKLEQTMPEGIRLPVELNDFIHSIVVGPEAESWFYELVSDMTERYGLNVPVSRSELTYLPE